MAEMRAMEFTGPSEDLSLRLTTRPVPELGDGELLIQICAAGVTPTEKLWYTTTHFPNGSPRTNAIPAHEFSGIVAALEPGISGYRPGDLVFGMNDWFADGAIAEFCKTKAASVASKPPSLSHAEAASAPIGSLTAWQGLHSHAKLRKGERVLVWRRRRSRSFCGSVGETARRTRDCYSVRRQHRFCEATWSRRSNQLSRAPF